jgi:ABC-2 type transport system permease protein
MAAIFMLTVRQLTGSRRVWLVLVLVALPLLAAVLYHVGDSTTTSAEFADDITSTLIASGILPLVMLLFGTSSFGLELGDRTLGYLALKPVPRWQLVVPKLAAAIVAGGLPVAASGAVAVAVIEGGGAGALATGLGLLVGAAAYAAVFTWAGLATRHALVFGLLYVVVWEATLAAYLDGVRFASIRQYALAIVRWLDDERLRTIDLELGPGAAVVGATIVVVGFTLLAVRRLSRMDVP